jgi:transposase
VRQLLRKPPPGADVYVQDEAEMSMFPTLTRMWTPRGVQPKIPAPGVSPAKRYESVAINWRTGSHERVSGLKRNADIFCHVVEKCVTRSAKRKRRVILITDGPRFHKPEGSKKVRALLERHGEHLSIVYIPAYDPDSNPTELHWRHWRPKVTHNHKHASIEDMLACSTRYHRRCKQSPNSVLYKIGSPFAV